MKCSRISAWMTLQKILLISTVAWSPIAFKFSEKEAVLLALHKKFTLIFFNFNSLFIIFCISQKIGMVFPLYIIRHYEYKGTKISLNFLIINFKPCCLPYEANPYRTIPNKLLFPPPQIRPSHQMQIPQRLCCRALYTSILCRQVHLSTMPWKPSIKS